MVETVEYGSIALYSNYDTWFAPKFLGDDVHTEAPESYAARLRQRF